MPEAFHGLQLPLSFPVLSKVGAAGGWLPCAHADVLAFGHGTHTLRQVPIEGIAVAWQTHGQDQVQDNCYTYSKISKPNWPRANQGITDDFLKWKSRYGHKKTMAIVNHGGHGVTRLGRLKSMHLVSPAGDSWQKKMPRCRWTKRPRLQTLLFLAQQRMQSATRRPRTHVSWGNGTLRGDENRLK